MEFFVGEENCLCYVESVYGMQALYEIPFMHEPERSERRVQSLVELRE